jgi:hypothetical protein
MNAQKPQSSLQLIEIIGKNKRHQKIGKYLCVCGTEFHALEYNVKGGHTKSCGCLKADLLRAAGTTHSEARPQTPEYRTWANIKTRCTNPKSKSYPDYGGRGITMHTEWVHSYEAFLQHVGRKPGQKHSIEHIHNDKGYEPGNVRWATAKEQARNRRSSRIIEFQGRSATLQEWADSIGIKQSTLFERLQKWPLERALTEAPNH